jgi:hypothetical protein
MRQNLQLALAKEDTAAAGAAIDLDVFHGELVHLRSTLRALDYADGGITAPLIEFGPSPGQQLRVLPMKVIIFLIVAGVGNAFMGHGNLGLEHDSQKDQIIECWNGLS